MKSEKKKKAIHNSSKTFRYFFPHSFFCIYVHTLLCTYIHLNMKTVCSFCSLLLFYENIDKII